MQSYIYKVTAFRLLDWRYPTNCVNYLYIAKFERYREILKHNNEPLKH